MIKSSRFAILAVLMSAGSLFAQDGGKARMEFEARYWLCDLDTQWKIRGPQGRSEFDFKHDLGMGDANLPDVRFSYSKGRSTVRFDYAQASYDGPPLARRIIFDGTPVDVGGSHSDFKQLRLSYIYRLASTRNGVFSVGLLVDAYGFNQKTRVGITDNRWFGVPGVGPALTIRPVKRIELFAEGSGMGMGRFGFQAGGEAGIRVIPLKHFAGTAGYRKLRARPEYFNDVRSEFPYINLNGAFIGISGRF